MRGDSGFESVGFNIGPDVVGVYGLGVGTVVIGVVMSICLVEIGTDESCNLEPKRSQNSGLLLNNDVLQ